MPLILHRNDQRPYSTGSLWRTLGNSDDSHVPDHLGRLIRISDSYVWIGHWTQFIYHILDCKQTMWLGICIVSLIYSVLVCIHIESIGILYRSCSIWQYHNDIDERCRSDFETYVTRLKSGNESTANKELTENCPGRARTKSDPVTPEIRAGSKSQPIQTTISTRTKSKPIQTAIPTRTKSQPIQTAISTRSKSQPIQTAIPTRTKSQPISSEIPGLQ